MSIIVQAGDALAKKKYMWALELYQMALREDKNKGLALSGLAQTLYHLHKYDDAFARAKEALAEQASSAAPHLILANIYARQLAWDDSMSEVQKALEIDPQMREALALRSGILITLDRKAEALEDIRRLIALDNTDWVAHF